MNNNTDLKKNLLYKNGDENFNLGKKIQSSKWFKVCIFSLIMLGILSVSFLNLMNNLKYVIKQSIIKTFKKIDNVDNLDRKMQFEANIKLKGDLLSNTLNKDSFSINGFVDLDNEKLQLSVSVLENNQNIIDGTVFYDGDKTYIASSSLLDNVYDVSDCTDKNDFACKLTNFQLFKKDNLGVSSKDVSVDKAIDGLKSAILDSVNNNNTYRNKGTFNEENVNFKKYTLKLDKDTVSSIYSKLNDSAKFYLNKIVYNFIDDVNSKIDVDKIIVNAINDMQESLEINIYTSGLLNKFAMIEIGNNSSVVHFSYTASSKKMSLSLPKTGYKLETTKDDGGKISGTIYAKNKLFTSFNYYDADDASTFSSKFTRLGMTFNVNANNKLDKSSQDKIKGLLNINVSLDTFIYKTNISTNVDYNASNKISMASLNVSKTRSYSEMSQAEKDNVSSKVQDFWDNILGSWLLWNFD